MSKITYEKIKEFIESKGCKLLTTKEEFEELRIQYKTLQRFNLRIACSICGREYKCNYTRFKSSNKVHCNECSFEIRAKKKRSSINDIKDIIHNDGSGCTLLEDDYINTKTKMNFQCKCGNKFKTSWENYYYRNVRCCEDCRKERDKDKQIIRWNIEKIKEFIISNNIDCKLISTEYHDYDSLLEFECKCGEHFFATLDNFIRAGVRQCNKCGHERGSNKQKGYTIEEIRKIVENNNKNIELLSTEYINAKELLYFRCLDCEEIFGRSWDTMNNLHLFTCPRCNPSKGEARIIKFLKNSIIDYKREYVFDDLVSESGNYLRFDFVILNKNKINYLIEYDGEYHYEPIINEEELNGQKYRDNLKNEYCIKNNLQLIRIPYWDFDNIEEILDDILIHNNLNSNYIINDKLKKVI